VNTTSKAKCSSAGNSQFEEEKIITDSKKDYQNIL